MGCRAARGQFEPVTPRQRGGGWAVRACERYVEGHIEGILESWLGVAEGEDEQCHESEPGGVSKDDEEEPASWDSFIWDSLMYR